LTNNDKIEIKKKP